MSHTHTSHNTITSHQLSKMTNDTQPRQLSRVVLNTHKTRTQRQLARVVQPKNNTIIQNTKTPHQHARLTQSPHNTNTTTHVTQPYQTLQTLLTGRESNIWTKEYSTELAILEQGFPERPIDTNTFTFIPITKIPPSRLNNITYGKIVSSIHPLKTEKHRILLTVGGNLIQYPYRKTTPIVDVLSPIFYYYNRVISTPKSRLFTIDIKDFYLHNTLPYHEYMVLPNNTIPDDIKMHYNLHNIQQNGKVYT